LPPMVGWFPQTTGGGVGQGGSPSQVRGTVQYFLLPFIEQQNPYNQMAVNHPDSWWCTSGIKTYVSPADQTDPPSGLIDTGSPRYGTSYAPNEWVFDANNGNIPGVNGSTQMPQTVPVARIPATFADGTTQTIVFAEKYAVCGTSTGSVATFYWGETGGTCNRVGGQGGNGSVPGFYTLALPQQKPNPFGNCNPCMLQAYYSGGINVGLGDGSVRLVSAGVSQTTWANAVTPNDGAVLGSDW